MAAAVPDLTVRGEPVERIYGNYEDRRYVVNRRYQRKLIWTLEEKQNFIDSLIEGFPIPIILLAESAKKDDNTLEIIDGMQRLDAIVSFISNKYSVRDCYFDLNTIAVTKALLDNGTLTQLQPVMARDVCVEIASYLVPLSIYEFADEKAVDTVFRRINSGGRQLSRQELRSAGSVEAFATVVRRLAAKVRGDDSLSDQLKLNEMQKISITNKDLNYGIDVDGIFWVAQGVLSRDHVRQSRDEEIIADIVAYMVSEDPISSRTEFIDDFYGMTIDDAGAARFKAVDTAIKKRTPELVVLDFQRTLDQIKLTLQASGLTFAQLMFKAPGSPAPRYFQAVFLAFHDLIVRKNMMVSDRAQLIAVMKESGDHMKIQEGGRWGAENRQVAVDAAIGMYQKAFAPAKGVDPALVHWITQLENLLNQSYTEQAAYDFKQGFLRLDGSKVFDEDSFQKILRTCVAISNLGKNHKGYVIVGVAETSATAAQIEKIYGVKSRSYDRFYLSGVEHEATALGKSLDQFFQFIVDKTKYAPVSEPLKSYITSNIKSVRYYDRTIYVFEARGQEQPSLYDGKYFERMGAQLSEVQPKDFPDFFARYTNN
ncbi:MAG: DUF262 domain-containing protein [Rubrivivax sp.]